MQLFVKDAASGLGIDGAFVLIRKDSDGSSISSATTNTSGMVDVNVPAGVPCNALVSVPGYDGVSVSVSASGGVIYPSTISLLKVTSRVMKLSVFLGNYSTPLNGARVEVKKPDSSSFLVQFTGSDGKYQTVLQADLTGWTVTITSSGVDGVVLPLDKIDLVGEVRVLLAPVS